jgi:hypothetical protein
MDNYAAHKRAEIRTWLSANPRIQVHFTPTSGSWLNLVEVWFGIIERQAIHRGTFRSVRDLMIKIRQFIDGWNDRKHPFIWTKTAEDVLDKSTVKGFQRQTTRSSGKALPSKPPDQTTVVYGYAILRCITSLRIALEKKKPDPASTISQPHSPQPQ